MSFTKTIEFANYTLNFGTDKVLLDAFESIVLPSFSDQKYIRKFKDTEYFFTETRLISLDTIDAQFEGPIAFSYNCHLRKNNKKNHIKT